MNLFQKVIRFTRSLIVNNGLRPFCAEKVNISTKTISAKNIVNNNSLKTSLLRLHVFKRMKVFSRLNDFHMLNSFYTLNLFDVLSVFRMLIAFEGLKVFLQVECFLKVKHFSQVDFLFKLNIFRTWILFIHLHLEITHSCER